MVDGWKLLDDANVSQVLKINPDNLKVVNDFMTTKGIDYSILNTELDDFGFIEVMDVYPYAPIRILFE